MSTLLVQSGTFDNIADAIRAKTGKVASMTPLEMPQEIASISGGGGGGVTILSGTENPTANQGVDGQIYLINKSKLVNSGYSWINTNYVMQSNTVFEMNCKITGGGAWPVPFGARNVNSNAAGAKEWMIIITGGYFNYDADIGLKQGPAVSKYMNKDITMRLGNNQFVISSDEDTDTYTFTQGNPTTYPMYLFNLNGVGSTYGDATTYIDFYSFTIYEGDTIVHKFVPAYNNNQYCVYDEITDEYKYKSGNGVAFTGAIGISNAKLKVSGAWQNLIGSDIDDVNLGS